MKKIFPNEIITTTKYFGVHQDWEVPIPGFFIITSRKNRRSIADFKDKEAEEFIKLVQTLRKGMKDILKIEDIYLFQNEDSKHKFHLWMFPRYDWMEKFGRNIQSVRPIMNYAKENMVKDNIIKEVKEMAEQMRKYLLLKTHRVCVN